MELEGTVAELAGEVLGGSYHIKLEANGQRPSLSLAEALRRTASWRSRTDGDSTDRAGDDRTDLRAEAAKPVVQAGGRLLALDSNHPAWTDLQPPLRGGGE